MSENIDDWEMLLEEHLATNAPLSFIYDEGGPDGIAQGAIERSDNLWESLCHVWRTCAVEITGRGMYSYNDTFYQAMKATVPDSVFPKATIADGGAYVIFDVDAIEVECARVNKYPESIRALTAEIADTLTRIKPIVDKYSLEQATRAVMAECEKQHDVKLGEPTARQMAMARNCLLYTSPSPRD